jgi:hypothetical protein
MFLDSPRTVSSIKGPFYFVKVIWAVVLFIILDASETE